MSNWAKAEVPNLWDLMSDDLSRSWCNNNKNKVHNKCNVLESPWNHALLPGPWKNCLPRNQSLVPKKLGTIGKNLASLWIIQGILLQRCATNIFTITLMKCLYLKPITAALVQTTGFRMEKVVTMSLKAGNFGTLVERIVGRRALIFCK